MEMDTSTAKSNFWFAELDMEDPMLLQEFVEDCLVDYPSEDMETIMREVSTHSSPGSDSNSSNAILQIDNNKHYGTTPKSPSPEEGMKHAGSTTTISRKRRKRLPEQCQNHIIAERQRRQTLSERFIAMAALIPGLKKLDKTTVLGAAIIHMQQLKERIKMLEEENAKKAAESIVLIKPPQVMIEKSHGSNSSTSNDNLSICEQLPYIEARFSSTTVLIRISCEMQKGVVLKIMEEIEKLRLSVTSINAMPFDGTSLDITIITQMEPGFNKNKQDVVSKVRSAFQ